MDVRIESSLFSKDAPDHTSRVTSFEKEAVFWALGIEKHTVLAAAEASEAMAFAYRTLRIKKFYAEAKEHLLTQLFKTTRRQLSRLSRAHGPLDVGLVSFLTSYYSWWLAVDAPALVYFCENGSCKQIKTQPQKLNVPFITNGPLRVGQTMIIASENSSAFFQKNFLQSIQNLDDYTDLLSQKLAGLAWYSVFIIKIHDGT